MLLRGQKPTVDNYLIAATIISVLASHGKPNENLNAQDAAINTARMVPVVFDALRMAFGDVTD